MWTTLPLSPAIVRLVTQGTPVRLVCSRLVKCDKELHNYSQRAWFTFTIAPTYRSTRNTFIIALGYFPSALLLFQKELIFRHFSYFHNS